MALLLKSLRIYYILFTLRGVQIFSPKKKICKCTRTRTRVHSVKAVLVLVLVNIRSTCTRTRVHLCVLVPNPGGDESIDHPPPCQKTGGIYPPPHPPRIDAHEYFYQKKPLMWFFLTRCYFVAHNCMFKFLIQFITAWESHSLRHFLKCQRLIRKINLTNFVYFADIHVMFNIHIF